MPRFILEIPAYVSVGGDVDSRRITVSLPDLPREGDQIEVPNGGIVHVNRVRHRPCWVGDRQSYAEFPGGRSEGKNNGPEVFTSWVARPDDAPKSRRPI